MKLKDTGLTAEELKDIVKKYMVETYARYDFIAERAEGMYLYDEKGVAYLDFYGGVAVNTPGNRNPKVVAAVKDQLDDIMHTFNYPYTIPQALLAKKICDTIGMDKIFFQNSGTEANECMIKMARKYGVEKYGSEHYHIVTAINGFHGRTYGALSATGQPDNACQLGFKPMLPGFSYAEYNNLEDFKSKVTDNTIAIMIEPVQGEGGVHPATQEFIEGLRKLCDERGMLLLLDEVQTGWGRTGSPMAFMGYGVKPDCVTMAKAMGGGMPIGACCASEEVAAVFTSGTHGSTYGGHPLACAASLASISEILDKDLSGNAKVMGEYMKEKLAELPHVKEARGKGLLVGCEYDIPIALEVKWACFRRRLLITAIGISFLLENGAQLLFGADTKSMDTLVPGNVSFGSVTISYTAILTIIVAVIAMVALTLLVQKTKLGKAMRAVSEDMGAAQLMGISLNKTISFTFAVGSALAGIGSVLYLCAYSQASPTMGSMLGLKAFVAAVLGGIGSIPGAMIGGFAIGLLEALVAAVGLSVWKDAVVFAILIVVLLVKPSGIMGHPVTEKV